MDQNSKRRSRPALDAIKIKSIAFNLEEALSVENIYRPNWLAVNTTDRQLGEVTPILRDSSVEVLRFLKIWFDLPQNVYFLSISYLDMFLTKMKVLEKYLKCVTVSCFYLAANKYEFNIDANKLVEISQSRCTSKDMLRMAGIIKNKLGLEDDNTKSDRTTTPADFLRIFLEIFECLKYQSDNKLILMKKDALYTYLEIILSDSSCAFYRSSAIALGLIQYEIEKLMALGLQSKSKYFIGEVMYLLHIVKDIQQSCKIKTPELKSCFLHISKVLKLYENEGKGKHRQELLWKFSISTINKAHSNRNYQPRLGSIRE